MDQDKHINKGFQHWIKVSWQEIEEPKHHEYYLYGEGLLYILNNILELDKAIQ